MCWQPHNAVTLNRCSTLVSKHCVRAQQSECVGIKTLSQRYGIHDSCLYRRGHRLQKKQCDPNVLFTWLLKKKKDIFYVSNVLLNDTNQIQKLKKNLLFKWEFLIA